MEENIVITAPFDINSLPEAAPAVTAQTGKPASNDATPGLDSTTDVHTSTYGNGDENALPEIASATLPAEMNEAVAIAQPGIFRRLLSFLFRRSRQPA